MYPPGSFGNMKRQLSDNVTLLTFDNNNSNFSLKTVATPFSLFSLSPPLHLTTFYFPLLILTSSSLSIATASFCG
ncbi:hypothetical protein RIF29_40632 [Crotalaria pallida]|uniref:Uncharacterized protein n=1 Tax=Crotalaria pallida TaxID=3830 RepID=A0AAN9E9S5_CROPI